MERITYKEHDQIELENFNLNVFRGEILGFLPVNSYGLRTFLNLLKSNLSLYDGYVYYNENLINSWKYSDMLSNKITVIEDKPSLVPDITVSDNIFVLRKGFKQEIISRHILEKQLKPFLEEINIDIPANAYADNLSVFERIVVEILKGVVAGHKLFILFEVQTQITGVELLELYKIVKYYASKGYSFIYIASHLEEVLNICDRIVFLKMDI